MEYSEKDLIEVDPTTRVDALMHVFAEYKPVLKRKNDDGYDWLEDDECVCIIIPNPLSEALDIKIELAAEFTLYFGGSHCHYWSYESGYEDLIEGVHSIVRGELCSFGITYGGWDWCSGFWNGKQIDKNECAKYLRDNAAEYIYLMKTNYDKELKPDVIFNVWLRSFKTTLEIRHEWRLKELIDVSLSDEAILRLKITEKLRRIEHEYDVKILLAVESGSRAWGFASPDSDYDVRFIYVHKPEWYFRVARQPDTIEYMSGDRLLDFSGWELRKTLQLLSKTNPNLSDWLLTDKIYLFEDEFLHVIREVQSKFYNPIHAMYHFFNIAKRHDEAYLRRNGCMLKKFLYFLRGLLACEYIEQYQQHPPVDFRELVDLTISDGNLKGAVNSLLELKTKSKEHDSVIVDEALQNYAYGLYNEREKKLADFRPALNDRSLSDLDAILYRYASCSNG